MKDIVIGCITNYTYDKIHIFVNSLELSGFDGYKVMIVYNVPFSTVSELKSRGWTVIAFSQDIENQQYTYKDNFRIMCDRQLHYYQTLQQLNEEYTDLRYVIACDPKDVIFQQNPSKWIEENIVDKKIIVGSESLKYKDEQWNQNNLIDSFGDFIYDRCQDNLVYNCGTVSGDWKTMSELFLNIYLLCVGSPNNTPDQAALNTLLSFDVYKNITKFATSEDSWACQCGTTIDMKVVSINKHNLAEPQPYLDGDIVKTNAGIPFTLVHQYDRITEWKEILENKYK
jgi:hypothetical protein